MPDPPLVPMPLARGTRGAVVAPHHLATSAGLGVLAAGGSAVDAAIATNAVLGVVVPQGCGIGGDAFWLIWDQIAGRQYAVNGSGRSSREANAAALRNRGLRSLPLRGGLAITVPGAVRSWGDVHARFGRLPRSAVLLPAIELARDGFAAWDGLVDAVERTATILVSEGLDGAGFRSVFRPHGRPWWPGEEIRLPALARTLQLLADDGFDAFYEGAIAEHQARALIAAGSMIDAQDLAEHRTTWTDPIETTYRGVRVTTHPPNSSGVVALEILNILERFERADPATWAHLGIEASKLAMADRDALLTDPDFHDVGVERLIDKTYAAQRAAQIDPQRVAPPPVATSPRGGDTIYLATVDADGNAVSLIESNYMGFGSGVVDPVTGIHYQNRGSYFSLAPGHPNVLEPRKRTLHTLMPGMLFRTERREPWVVLGSMGGDAQPQIHAQVVSALVDDKVDVGTAVARPRWFVEPERHFEPPVAVLAEPRFEFAVLERLKVLGHPVSEVTPFDSGLGHCHAIELVDGGPAARGSVAAATDPRSAGLPAVR